MDSRRCLIATTVLTVLITCIHSGAGQQSGEDNSTFVSASAPSIPSGAWYAESGPKLVALAPTSSDDYKTKKQRVSQEIRKQNKNWVAGVNDIFLNRTSIKGLFGAKALSPPKAGPGGVPHAPPRPIYRRLPPKRGGGNSAYTPEFYESNPQAAGVTNTADGTSSSSVRRGSGASAGFDPVVDSDPFGPPAAGNATHREKRQTLPAIYDVRRDYPECYSIDSIRDQRGCGGCYAFAASSVMSDRHCIYNFRTTGQIFISTYQVLSCVPGGCKDGGWEWDSFAYWKKKGLVTGSTAADGVNQPTGCLPLPASPSTQTSACQTKCSNPSYSKTFEADKTYAGLYGYKWFPTVEWMKQEIYQYGPIVSFMQVFEDFMYYYKGGVYEHVSGNLLGAHAVKLIGWGTEGGVDYWLAVNSWGKSWGPAGTPGIFKIKRGVNMAQIEARVSWVLPREGAPTSKPT